MIAIASAPGAEEVLIVGQGISLAEAHELEPGIEIVPAVPKYETQQVADGARTLVEYASILAMAEHASFTMRVFGTTGAALAAKAWNALWLFHLLSLAARAPCCSLYSVSGTLRPMFAVANRNLVFAPSATTKGLVGSQLGWAVDRREHFGSLISETRFNTAMRCFGNAHYLPDLDTRIMLLWSGIEGLLGVDAELSRRISLYAALLHRGTAAQREEYFGYVKKAYVLRSKVVHGSSSAHTALETGYREATAILADLLARCVDLGRVPSTAELDAVALSGESFQTA